jgi:hypothetical protein
MNLMGIVQVYIDYILKYPGMPLVDDLTILDAKI